MLQLLLLNNNIKCNDLKTKTYKVFVQKQRNLLNNSVCTAFISLAMYTAFEKSGNIDIGQSLIKFINV